MFKVRRYGKWLIQLETRMLTDTELTTFLIEDVSTDFQCEVCEMPDNSWVIFGHGQKIKVANDQMLSIFFKRVIDLTLEETYERLFKKN
jgi:hypothetical protein